MGKRGPKPGVVSAKKRILIAKRLVIHSDHELVLAQHLNEHLEDFLMRVEDNSFPLTVLEPAMIDQVVDATEILQHAVIEGIENYSVRLSPSSRTVAPEGDAYLRGAYALGRKRGRPSIGDRQMPGEVEHRLS